MDVLISLNNGKSFISSAYTITASTCVSLDHHHFLNKMKWYEEEYFLPAHTQHSSYFNLTLPFPDTRPTSSFKVSVSVAQIVVL